jgi:hypothetical protein
MRGRILAIGLVMVGLLVPAPASAPAADCGEGKQCGVPSCWEPSVRVRPGMARELLLSCWNATGAKLLTPPEHGVISAVSTDWYGVRFTMLAHGDAPRWDTARFEVQGHEGSVELDVTIEVVPLAENSAPVCTGDRVSQRSDGSGPVAVYMHPYCHDPDLDEMVMDGGGPGVHPYAPKSVPAGHGESNWPYRTATHAGTEVATIFATDVLGARSADATLEVTVGPGVDRLPDCRPGSAHYDGSGVFPIYSRPGLVRRFGILCSDEDGDVFTTAPTQMPARGALALVPGLQSNGPVWGFEQWYDTTYVPADSSLEPDDFTLTSTGERGAVDQRFRIVPRVPPTNDGGGCGWSGSEILPDTAGVVTLSCTDDDGDPLTVEVIGGPLHGKAGPVAVVPDLYGWSKVNIPYVPDTGYEGYDCVTVRVTDGNGLSMEIAVDVYVRKPIAPPVPLPIPLPLPPLPLPLPLPAPAGPPPAGPGTLDQMVRTYVREALGTISVKQLPSVGDTQVWTAAKLSRKELMKAGHLPAMVVLCPGGCSLRSESEIFTGSRRRARASRRSVTQVVAAGRAQLLWLTLDGDQRAPLRKARKARADFKLAVRPAGGARRTVKRSITLSG